MVVKKNPDHLEKSEGESPEIILVFFFIVTVKILIVVRVTPVLAVGGEVLAGGAVGAL